MVNTNNAEKINLDRIDWKSSREFFESLGEALDKLDDKDKSYSFTWAGKRKSIIEADLPINKTLRPELEASKNFGDTKNMLIIGDNLDEGTGLVACFDDNISEDTIKEIAKMKSSIAAFKDSSFVDSAAKINLSEQFRIISPDTKVKVI